MKYKVKKKDCQLVVRAKAGFGETINETTLNAFERVFLRGFLKPRIIRKNVIEYTGPVGVSFSERLKKPVTKRDFLFLVEQVVLAFVKIQSNRLPIEHIVMDINYVFVNENTKEVQFLYVPSSAHKQNDILTLLDSIIYSAQPSVEKDMDYISRFAYFLRAQKGFDPERIERFVMCEDKTVIQVLKRNHAGQSGFMTDKRQHYYDHYSKKDSDDTDLIENEDTNILDIEETGLLYEDEKSELSEIGTDMSPGMNFCDDTGLLVDDENTGLLNDEGDTGLLNDERDSCCTLLAFDDENTGLLVGEEPYSAAVTHTPTLVRTRNDETIYVDKPVFRIGKGQNYVDYVVEDNNAVSRSHADIINRKGKCFVIDLNSTNHTYVNNQVIPSNCETPLCEGDRLILGNEEFVFHE